MPLDENDNGVRNILIEVAKGNMETHRNGLISYKELWLEISTENWSRSRTPEIVSIITRISGFELSEGRPPLNELVVRKLDAIPGENWDNIKTYLSDNFDVEAPYNSHREAQEACWKYWIRNRQQITDEQVEEGYIQDKKASFRTRNARIIRRRKAMDNYTCQACAYTRQIGDKHIIDCHHKDPIGISREPRITHIDDLVCLCPNCHRIAHTEKYPLTVEEIRRIID